MEHIGFNRQPENFDPHSGSWLERIIFRRRLLIVLISAIITILLGWHATTLRLNAGYEKMIPLSHEFISNYLSHRSELAGLGNNIRVVVSVKEGSIFTPEYIEALREISDELYLLPGVERAHMKSLWTPSVRWVAVTEEGLEGGPVMPDNFDGSPESLEQLRRNILQSGQVGQLVGMDFKSSAIAVPLYDENVDGNNLDYANFSTSLEKIRQQHENDNLKIHIIGFAKIVGNLLDGIWQVLSFFFAAIIICALVLYWYTRCIRSTGIVLSCSLLAVMWLLGLLPLLRYELDPYSVLVPFLVFAIGMSHGAQKMNGIMQDVGRGMPRLIAARLTFRRLFVPGVTALLADVVGFAVLLVIHIQVIHDLALTASIGVAILIFTNLVLLPILLSYVGVSKKAAVRSLRDESDLADPARSGRHYLWNFLILFTEKKWASWTVIGALFLTLGGYSIARHLEIGDLESGAPELRSSSRYNQDNSYINLHYATGSDVFAVMARTQPSQCNTYQNLDLVDALEWRLKQNAKVESTNSFASFAKLTAVGLNEGSFAWYDLPRNQNILNSVANRGASRELINQNCDLLTIYAYLKDHKADTLQQVVEISEEFAAKYNGSDIQFLLAAGNAGIEAATNIVVEKADQTILWLVFAAVAVLAFITFRSIQAVLCALIPLFITTVLAKAVMVALNIGVKVATLPVIALGVGIGVDYALYVLSVMLVGLKEGLPLGAAYRKALLFTGKVVVLTGITLSLAVSVWTFSPIKFQADMGILLAFMFLWNMVGALVLMPALSRFLLKSRFSG